MTFLPWTSKSPIMQPSLSTKPGSSVRVFYLPKPWSVFEETNAWAASTSFFGEASTSSKISDCNDITGSESLISMIALASFADWGFSSFLSEFFSADSDKLFLILNSSTIMPSYSFPGKLSELSSLTSAGRISCRFSAVAVAEIDRRKSFLRRFILWCLRL